MNCSQEFCESRRRERERDQAGALRIAVAVERRKVRSTIEPSQWDMPRRFRKGICQDKMDLYLKMNRYTSLRTEWLDEDCRRDAASVDETAFLDSAL